MKVTFALVLLSQALSLVSGTRCNADNCARQVTGDRYAGYLQNQRRTDCTKYLVKTTYRGISTKWVTRTIKKVATKTVKKTVTKTVGKVATKTVGKVVTKIVPKVVTSYTTRTVRITSGTTTITVTPPVASVTKRDLGLEKEHENMDMLETRSEHENMDILEARGYNYPPKVQSGVVKNCVGWRYVQGNDNCDNIVKRFSKAPIALTKANLLKWNPALKNGSGLRKGYWVCVRIDNMPSYISACDAQRYTSACSCWGIKPGTKTICSKTTTKTATRTSTSTATRTSTLTKTKTTTGTVTKTSTSTRVVTSTSTKVIVVDKTSVIPASTATVTSLPDGHIVCGGQAVNPFNNDNHCGKCNVACSTYCQAGACAGCTATTSICEDGGGHLCGDDSTCICTLNIEGQRTCAVSSNCEGDVCSKSSDCQSGWTCVPGTCCGDEPVCMRAPSGCPNGQNIKRIFKREPLPSGTISKRRILVPEFDLSWKLARMKNKV
ncbi:hypothetical protein AOL_s00081g343 [Orbilia oligospora ATCC 24927]|uniref:LysM domain-containing protein n=1 Tax=Arthrobotrys oligospora (strain ATCC 24927 / CBS 115.81 / DSM 1491) TaxID=756982 RepID=G1XG50_ARTOA|nr:hypothetical protein AOL_s00081g343 [Orbilia oligospora ATCC 24927]EGX48016.1 hypothetical protein AOL_s00081g343 [Orbilia oligospora ATCC 24927]